MAETINTYGPSIDVERHDVDNEDVSVRLHTETRDSEEGWVTLGRARAPHAQYDAARWKVEAFFHQSTATSITVTLGPPVRHGSRIALAIAIGLVILVGSIRHALHARPHRSILAKYALAILTLGILAAAAWYIPRIPPRASAVALAPRDDLEMIALGPQRLSLQAPREAHAAAGTRLVLAMANRRIDWPLRTYSTNVHWSVAASSLAMIENDTGVLTLSPNAPDRTVLDVTAEVGPERWPFRGRVTIYRQDERPLIGSWQQVAEEPCSGLIRTTDRVRRLVFGSDDMWRARIEQEQTVREINGTYAYDRASGRISMRELSPSKAPAGFSGDGTATVELQDVDPYPRSRTLYLEGIWLGDGGPPPSDRPCKLRFAGW
ncbi:Hypothetical protein A7982_10730 [Minicystis rosea]|nr:Hypothetical protein A7982_10730 [Minicystis rosea]